MIQDIPAEEILLALLVARPELTLDDRFAPEILTDARRELGGLLARVRLEGGVAGYETLRGLGATAEALKSFDYAAGDGEPIESFVHLCQQLRKVAVNREAHDLCRKIHREVMDPEADPSSYLDRFVQGSLAIRDLLTGRDASGGVRRGGDIAPLLAMLEETLHCKGKVRGLRTGFYNTDWNMDGLNPGRLYLIGARPSVGKTSLLLSWARNLLDGIPGEGDSGQAPQRGMIFTCEMPFKDIQMNLLVQHSMIGRERLRDGATRQMLEILKGKIKEMAGWDYEIDDTQGIPIDLLCHRARRAHADKPLKWIGVDYIQLVKGCERKSQNSRQVEVGEVSSKLKGLSKELSVPVIGLAQLKRPDLLLDQGKGRKVAAKPRLQDLRESGDMEQDSDWVGMIHRDQEGEDEEAEVIVEKNRFGPLHPGIRHRFAKATSSYSEK